MNLSMEANGALGVIVDILLLAVGFVLIIKGGDFLVDASIWMARALKVPEIIIGATIVSIGTTLPELITSTTSVIKGMTEGNAALVEGYNVIAVGNAVGSMMCNIGLILGIVMLIRPPKTEGKSFAIKGIYLLCVSVVLCIFALTNGAIELWEGIVLLVFFVLFIGINLYEAAVSAKSAPALPEQSGAGQGSASAAAETVAKDAKTVIKRVLQFVIGAAATALGAMLLVDNAQSLCVGIGIPQQIVGITVVAIGTSLPELVTSLTSLKKGTSDIGLGNIIGANIINATLLLGLISCITGQGLTIDAITKNVAVWVMLGISALLIVPSVIGKKTYRWQGAAMLALYLGFIVYNIIAVVI